jgi:DNA-binding response OmpR family regulator
MAHVASSHPGGVAAPMLCEMSPRVLLVEDDDMIARPLTRTLEREGYDVDRVAEGLAAVDSLTTAPPDLLLLDLGLPDIDGLEVCRRAREGGFTGGIMILTARGGELDRVVGLDIGADDYLAKPFPLSELLARVRALLRRSGSGVADAAVAPPRPYDSSPDARAGGGTPAATPHGPAPSRRGLRIDTRARRVWVGVEELTVSAKEFDVLALLDAEPGAVITRERLMDEVWDENWFGSTRTLDATVGRLRQKFDERQVPARISTVRGVGFRIERDGSDA